tara:strand:- start:5474 stop:5968 length:495 start_codon:yes stop_codon:yes gene_type:complete
MFKYIVVLMMSLSLMPTGQAGEKPAACSSDEYSTLDFWVGSWEVSWKGGKGTNHISKSHGGCVINEKFDSPGLKGMSISMYNKAGGEWRQTWMDDQGSYFDFHGRQDGADYIFHSTPDPEKPEQQLRMVFTDIKADQLTWLWQKTSDGGETWTDQWMIKYSRRH